MAGGKHFLQSTVTNVLTHWSRSYASWLNTEMGDWSCDFNSLQRHFADSEICCCNLELKSFGKFKNLLEIHEAISLDRRNFYGRVLRWGPWLFLLMAGSASFFLNGLDISLVVKNIDWKLVLWPKPVAATPHAFVSAAIPTPEVLIVWPLTTVSLTCTLTWILPPPQNSTFQNFAMTRHARSLKH